MSEVCWNSRFLSPCLDLRCKDPPRGRSLNIKLTNGRYFGSMATHSCNSPYKLRGSAIRTCRAIGKWDGKKAKCSEYVHPGSQ